MCTLFIDPYRVIKILLIYEDFGKKIKDMSTLK